METKGVEEPLGLRRHLLEGIQAPLWRLVAYDLDLVELMYAKEATGVSPRCPGLAPKAGRVGRVPDREVLRFQQLVAMHVRDGHLGRRDRPEVVALRVVRLLGELRQLSGSRERLGVHEIRHAHFDVSVLAGVPVEEEVDKAPLESSTCTDQHRKTGPGDLRPAGKIKDPERLGEFPVRARLEVEDGGVTRRLLDAIRPFVTGRHVRMGKVGQPDERLLDAALRVAHPLVEDIDLVSEPAHLRDDLGRILAGSLELADPLRGAVPPSLEIVDRGKRLATYPVPRNDLPYLRAEVASTGLERGRDLVAALADLLQVEHQLLSVGTRFLSLQAGLAS